MELRWNKTLFPSLNVIKGKISPYVSKVILGRYYYIPDPKLSYGIVEIIIIPFSCHA